MIKMYADFYRIKSKRIFGDDGTDGSLVTLAKDLDVSNWAEKPDFFSRKFMILSGKNGTFTMGTEAWTYDVVGPSFYEDDELWFIYYHTESRSVLVGDIYIHIDWNEAIEELLTPDNATSITKRRRDGEDLVTIYLSLKPKGYVYVRRKQFR